MVSGKVFIDQMGYEVLIPHNPIRIISLVPSQTELLFYLGLDAEIIGITKFCIYPSDKIESKTKIGGTKNFDFDKIQSLNPDLVIGNKEENYQEGIEILKAKYPVWMSDITTLEQALDMIKQLGIIVKRQNKSIRLISKIKSVLNLTSFVSSLKVIYIIWNKPLMAVGKGTFIDEMLKYGGFENVLLLERYPEITKDRIKSLKPDVILLSTEPFPFSQKHKVEFENTFEGIQVEIVDGEMFSWYGSRLLKSAEYIYHLRERINPTFSRSDQNEG